MAIFGDNVGNKFLGDCIWANHSVAYPNTKFLKANPHSTLSADLSGLLTSAQLQYRNVLGQTLLDEGLTNPGDGISLVTFATSTDTIDDRYVFYLGHLKTNTTNSLRGNCSIYNNSGYTATNNSFSTTNRIFNLSGGGVTDPGINGLSDVFVLEADNPVIRSEIQWVGVADAYSLGLYCYRYFYDTNQYRGHFMYLGMLDEINPNFDYYNQSVVTQSVAFRSAVSGRVASSVFPNIAGGHWITNSGKNILASGDAQYPIVCSDGQTPTAQWATDMYVFDNNATLGFPAMGRVRNLLLATGSYTIGKPVKIQGSAMPDAGFNRWLPVGTFSGKTVLMRCYSSVNI